MFSHLCRVRLWPRPRQSNICTTTGCSSPETTEAPCGKEEQPKKGHSDQGKEARKDLPPPKTAQDSLAASKGVQAQSALRQETKAAAQNQLELYLNWLLTVTESQQALSTPRPRKKSTDNPAYGLNCRSEGENLNTKVTRRRDCGAAKDRLLEKDSCIKTPSETPAPAEVQTRTCGRLQASIVHREGSRIRVSISKPKPRRETSGRSATGRCRLSGGTSGTEDSRGSRASNGTSDNRVHKRRHSSARRRMSRLQHQEALEEVVNIFGKQFNKALLNQMKNKSSDCSGACPPKLSSQASAFRRSEVKCLAGTVRRPVPRLAGSAGTRSSQTGQAPRNDSQSDSAQEEDEAQLQNATKGRPANVPTVVMQCSRFISHIRKEPPFLESSLPMGSLVTALCQEDEWLLVRTAHGQEGYVYANCCLPLGTLPKKRTVDPNPSYKPQMSDLKECAPSLTVESGEDIEDRLKTLRVTGSRTRDTPPPAFSPESTSTLLKKDARKPFERLKPRSYVMIRDYKGVGQNALDLKKGDIVTGIKRQQQDWVLAKSESGEFGYIPLSYTVQVDQL